MRYLRRLVFPAILLASRVALAQSNLVLLISPPGDYIGAGQTYYTTNQDEIGISGTLATITVWAFGFAMYFDAPDQSNLTVERYTNVVAYPRNWNEGGPGLTIMGNGRSCLGTACGDFEIREVQTNGN